MQKLRLNCFVLSVIFLSRTRREKEEPKKAPKKNDDFFFNASFECIPYTLAIYLCNINKYTGYIVPSGDISSRQDITHEHFAVNDFPGFLSETTVTGAWHSKTGAT